MKKMFAKNLSMLKLAVVTGLITGFVSLSGTSYAQTYYSKFANPTYGVNYQVTNPSGCLATPIQNTVGFVDRYDSTYAYFADSVGSAFSCDNNYSFDTYLNFPDSITSVGPTSNPSTIIQAGWKIQVPTGIDLNTLGKYIVVSTYLDGQFQEYRTGNLLRGINSDVKGNNWFIYFDASMPFNILEITVDPNIVPLDSAFEFRVMYAMAATSVVLPATIANFKAAVSGKNINLSWQSLTETNVSAYRIERSNNGGASYSAVTSIPAKGNSNTAITYSYNDAVSVNGNYLYRIVVVNKDGTAKPTGSVTAIISGQSKLLIYPTVLKAGQNINIRTSENGMTAVYVYDAQGRLAKQQRTNSSGQFSVATAGLATGVYTIKVISVSGSASQARVVIN